MSAASSFWTSSSDTSAFTMDPFLWLTRSKGGGGGGDRVWGHLTLGLFRSHCWQLTACAWDWGSVPPLHHPPLPGILAPPSAMPRTRHLRSHFVPVGLGWGSGEPGHGLLPPCTLDLGEGADGDNWLCLMYRTYRIGHPTFIPFPLRVTFCDRWESS